MAEEEVAVEPSEMDTPEAAVTEEVSEEPGELYAIKIDGEEQQVSLEELQAGYQRQGDYTRKTQELADERRRLAQAESIVTALENDPEATIGALARTFDVNTGNQSVSSIDDSYEMDEDLDPNARKIAELEARLEQQDRFQRQQQIEKTVSDLQERNKLEPTKDAARKIFKTSQSSAFARLAMPQSSKARSLLEESILQN